MGRHAAATTRNSSNSSRVIVKVVASRCMDLVARSKATIESSDVVLLDSTTTAGIGRLLDAVDARS